MKLKSPLISILVLTFGLVSPSLAGLELASPFADHMVLQRDRKVCIWGTGDDNTRVDVELASQRVTAIVGTNHCWKAYLTPEPAGGPCSMMVSSGESKITVKDILFGDIWLCSGQSNMQLLTKESDASEQKLMVAVREELRLCTVGKSSSTKPQAKADIKWRTCTQDTARNFSAVGYYFGSELIKSAAVSGVPIGLIDSSFGGTTCEGWIPQAALTNFNAQDLHDSMFSMKPSSLYNAMIAPLGESPIKGVVWYQGESNSGHPDTYVPLLSTMIAEWRKQFSTPDLPFLIVQLPDYASQWDGFYWQWAREVQAQVVQSTPNTALVVALNTTDGFDLHPKNKLEIGRRTALQARRLVYGERIVASGPIFKDAKVEGSTMRVTFDTGGDKLTNLASGGVRGFALAGEDGVYHFANAMIDGNSVVVHLDEVPAPKTVRYAWGAVPNASLFNKSGLPAAPFRTDHFASANIEVLKEPIAHHVTTSAYDILVDGHGKVTSLAVRGAQFLSNEPGMAGGTSIPLMFGGRSLPKVHEIGPDLFACSDDDFTFLFEFKENSMEWVLTNRGKDEVKLNIALSPLVALVQNGNTTTLTHKKSSMIIHDVDSISDSENGKVLQVLVKGKTSKRLLLDMTRN